jgi:hypothetical protein
MVQCQCKTKQGTQCSRNATVGNLCKQHANMPCTDFISTSVKMSPSPRAQSPKKMSPKKASPQKVDVYLPIEFLQLGDLAILKILHDTNVSKLVKLCQTNQRLRNLCLTDAILKERIEKALIPGLSREFTNMIEEAPVDNYWIDLMPSKYILSMKDLKDKNIRDQYVIPPQTYESVEKLSDLVRNESFEDYGFYDDMGHAVTGSGADTWGIYRPGLFDEMKKLHAEWTAYIAKHRGNEPE